MKRLMRIGLLSTVALLVFGFQNCGRFESTALDSGGGNDLAPNFAMMTEQEAIALGQGQQFGITALALPSYCALYPQYTKYWPQCQLPDPALNPIEMVRGGPYSPYIGVGAPSGTAYYMAFTIKTSVAPLTSIQVRLRWALIDGRTGETGWVNATSLGSDWIRGIITGNPQGDRYQEYSTFIPEGSYISTGSWAFSVRTSDGKYQKDVKFDAR